MGIRADSFSAGCQERGLGRCRGAVPEAGWDSEIAAVASSDHCFGQGFPSPLGYSEVS